MSTDRLAKTDPLTTEPRASDSTLSDPLSSDSSASSQAPAASAPKLAVSARDLSVRYPSRNPNTRTVAVNGVSFDLPAGEVLAIVGETGSGKSTLARTLALQSDTGEESAPQISGGNVSVLGMPLRGISRRRRDRLSISIGYLPQEAGDFLKPRLTIGENVAEPIFSRDARFDQDEAGAAVATLIDAVRLPLSTMNKYPHELSKGQRQRVAIARSIILEPRLLIADDPTAGIDVLVRGSILDIVVALQRERQFAAVVVTADLGEVRRVSDRVAVMHRGMFVAMGSVNDVIGDPRHPYVVGLAATLGATNTLAEWEHAGAGN